MVVEVVVVDFGLEGGALERDARLVLQEVALAEEEVA